MSTPNEEFQPRDGGDNSARINTFIREFENQAVTVDNYEKVCAQIESNNNIIDSQIENSYVEYLKTKQEFIKIRDSEYFKEQKERKLVDLDIYVLSMKLHHHSTQMLSWKYLQNDMNSMFLKKLVETLREAKSFDIKRDALKEMREMETKRNELFLDVMKSRNQSADEHLMGAVKEIQRIQKISDERNNKILAEALFKIGDSLVEAAKYNASMIERVMGKNDGVVFRETQQARAQGFSKNIVDGVRELDKQLSDSVSEDYESFSRPIAVEKPKAPVVPQAVDELKEFGNDDDDFLEDFKKSAPGPIKKK